MILPLPIKLQHACSRGNLDTVKQLLREGADVNSRNLHGMTPLHWACAMGHLHVAKYLIEKRNCSIEETDQFRCTCLDYACWQGYLSIVRYLIEERNADLRGKDCALYACGGGSFHVLQYLVEQRHMDITGKDRASLMIACANGHLPVVRYLIEQCHVSIEERNASDEACLFLACRDDRFSVVKYLILDCWMEPPVNFENSSFSAHMKQFLRTFTSNFLKEKRRADMMNFLSESGLRADWNIRNNPTFRLRFSLRIMHQYELIERYCLPIVDLKVCFEDSEKSHKLKKGINLVTVYAQKNQLGKSCTFMKNLLSGDFNDVQSDGSEENEMQSVQLSEALLQGCPSEWLKQLLIYLAWSEKGDQLYHHVNTQYDGKLSHQEIVKVFKYSRTCDALGLDVDVSAWTGLIKKYLERFIKEWIDSILKSGDAGRGRNLCIFRIPRFDEEMFDLCTQVMDNDDVLFFFLLVNAAPVTLESPKTIATKCREWLLSTKASGRYAATLKNSRIVEVLHLQIGIHFTSGRLFIAVDEYVKGDEQGQHVDFLHAKNMSL